MTIKNHPSSVSRQRWRGRLSTAVILLAAWTLLPVHAATAQPRPPAQPGPALALPALDTWELDNGMKVAHLRVDGAPMVAVQVWYHVGSKDEPRNRRGSAHMFEHMMFKGTQNVPPEGHARHINRIGGEANAFTSEDATAYVNLVPRSYLEFACQLEAERMRNLLFREDMIKTEREVVKEEIRQEENDPLSKGFLRFREVAYTTHPYAWTAGGTIADLDATTPDDLKRFYDTYYVPNNAMLVVVGDIERERVDAAAKRFFGPIARGNQPPRPASSAAEPAQTAMRREVVAPGQLGLLIAGYHVPEAKHQDRHALEVASLLLGAGESSRLHKRLVRADNVAVQAISWLQSYEHPGLLLLGGAYIDPAATDKLEASLLAEVEALKQKPVAAQELRKAKNQLQAELVFGLQSVNGLAQQIGQSWITSGDPSLWLRSVERYEAVTAADVQRVVRTYLTKENLTVVVVPPARN